jgi:hypothetical protein
MLSLHLVINESHSKRISDDASPSVYGSPMAFDCEFPAATRCSISWQYSTLFVWQEVKSLLLTAISARGVVTILIKYIIALCVWPFKNSVWPTTPARNQILVDSG